MHNILEINLKLRCKNIKILILKNFKIQKTNYFKWKKLSNNMKVDNNKLNKKIKKFRKPQNKVETKIKR